MRDFAPRSSREQETLVERSPRAVAAETGAAVEIEVKESVSQHARSARPRIRRSSSARARPIRRAGLTPIEKPIRGGTDGSRLSFMGLPTPNLFAGEHNFHSRLEWTSRQDLEAAVAVVIELARVREPESTGPTAATTKITKLTKIDKGDRLDKASTIY